MNIDDIILHKNHTNKHIELDDVYVLEPYSIVWTGKGGEFISWFLREHYNTSDFNLRYEIIQKMYDAKKIHHCDYNKLSTKNVSSKYSIIFVHIPKTAGMSFNNILGIDEIRKGHWELNQLQNMLTSEVYDSYTKIGVVRNPFERIVSLYSYRMKSESNWYPTCVPYDKIKEKTFDWWFWNFDVQLHLLSDPTMQSMSCYDCLTDSTGKLGVDRILRFEQLDEDWKLVCDELKIDAPSLPKINKSKHYHYSEYFDCPTGDKLKEFIYNNFKKDFEHFGYKFEDMNE